MTPVTQWEHRTSSASLAFGASGLGFFRAAADILPVLAGMKDSQFFHDGCYSTGWNK
jgi:hypothetical protein